MIGNRKSTDESGTSPAIKRRRAADDDSDISFSYSNISCNSTLNSSNQWEVRILKADLIEANTKVKQNSFIKPHLSSTKTDNKRLLCNLLYLECIRSCNWKKKLKIVHICIKTPSNCTKDEWRIFKISWMRLWQKTLNSIKWWNICGRKVPAIKML